jgi:hypothetical protein
VMFYVSVREELEFSIYFFLYLSFTNMIVY